MHGPLLRGAAARSSLWSRVVSAAAPDVAGRALKEGTPAELICEQAAQSYRSAAQQVGALRTFNIFCLARKLKEAMQC